MGAVATNQHQARWFVAWMAIGAAYAVAAVGVLTIGPLVLPVPIVATILAVRYQPSGLGTPGLVSGLGLPLLNVAYLNRAGPGTICTVTSSAHVCTQELSPWPWAAVGVLLLAGGLVIVGVRGRRSI